MVNNVKDFESTLLIGILNTKTKILRLFHMSGIFHEIPKKLKKAIKLNLKSYLYSYFD